MARVDGGIREEHGYEILFEGLFMVCSKWD